MVSEKRYLTYTMSKQNTNCEILPEGLEIRNASLYYNGNIVNSLLYGTINIEWNIFLTFHYRQRQYQKRENSEKRRYFYQTLMRDIARKVEGLTNSSIVYMGVGEYKNEVMHTHILVSLKDEHIYLTKKVQEKIYSRIDKKVVEISNKRNHPIELPPNIQEVISPSGASSYILKPDWMSMGNTDKEIIHTDMHGDIESRKNRFIARCNYFSNKKNNNSLKSNTSEINILDENIKNYRNARANPLELYGEVQCKDTTVEKRIFSKPFRNEKEINVQDFSGNDGLLSKIL